MVYDLTLTKVASISIEADSEEEAVKIASQKDIIPEWEGYWEVTDVAPQID